MLLFRSQIKWHENVCINHNICDAVMPYEEKGTLKYTQYARSSRLLFILYLGLEILRLQSKKARIRKLSRKSSKKKVGEHSVCGYSISTVCNFNEK